MAIPMTNFTRAKACNMFAVLAVLFTFSATESFVIDGHRSSFRERLSPVLLSSSPDAIHNEESSNGNNESCSGTISSINGQTRRRAGRLLFQSVLTGAFSWDSFRQLSLSEESPAVLSPQKKETNFISGKVTLPAGMNLPGKVETNNNNDTIEETGTQQPALYITARPNRPDNVPRAILDGSRGKPPPVLTARYESPTFPFEFELGEKDLTAEGADSDNNSGSSSNNSSTFWWVADDLVVSARWDNDGVAATRSPEDLVGRNVWKHDGNSAEFVLPLQGRGSFGKFATKKN